MKTTTYGAVNYLYIAASVVIIVLGLKITSGLLAPICLAAVLAILCVPLLRYFERKGLSNGLALAAVALIFGSFIILMFIIMRVSLERLSQNIPEYTRLLQQRIDSLSLNNPTSRTSLNTAIADTSVSISSIINIAISLVSSGVSVCFLLYLLFLMLAGSKEIAMTFRKGLQGRDKLLEQLRTFTKLIQKEYSLQAVSNLITAAFLTTEFIVFRVDFALLWGFLAFILGFIPYIGLIIACVPAIIIAFILHGWETALAILVIGIILNVAVDNVVMPRIFGNGLNIPVLFVFLSFIFWSWVFGFYGALLALPATLLVKSLLNSRDEAALLVSLLSKQSRHSENS